MTILAIDQGTTSSRAILYSDGLRLLAKGQQEFRQIFPKSGWVEHDPEEIWASVVATCKTATAGETPSAIGITNQRETVVVWDKTTGKPIYNAIVWQDRRTDSYCGELRDAGHEAMVGAKTGLLLDPYFSATKLKWILDNVAGARDNSNLLFGTMDTFLIWRLTNGQKHVTDATNAARTMMYNIAQGNWDHELLALFDIPSSMLPDVLDSSGHFGDTDPAIFGAPVPILGVAGDQQAATVGQACFKPGMMKSTYGTGCFALLNTGETMVPSTKRMLTTIAYQLDGKPTYALEGSIFIAGAVVQWLRDGLGIIDDASQTQQLAEAADPGQKLVMVPAFTGLGAPYWRADCRGAIFGLTRNSGPAEFARAALESVAFQTRDLIEAMSADWEGDAETVLRVDGGMTNSAWTMQALSDHLNAPVDIPTNQEATALGAAYLAGRAAGVCGDLDQFASNWALEKRYEPKMDETTRAVAYMAWKDAIARLMA